MKIKLKVKKTICSVISVMLLFGMNVNTLYAGVSQVDDTLYNNQIIDITSLVNTEEVSHSHIWEDEYDDAYMWQKCSVCGKIRNKKKHDVLVKYNIAENTCHPQNIKITYSTECDYYKEEAWSKKEHEPLLTSDGKQAYSVNKYNYTYRSTCKNCGETYNQKPCVSKDGNPITNNSPRGTKCEESGFIFDKYFKQLRPDVVSDIKINADKSEATITLTTNLPIVSSTGDFSWYFPPCLVTWWIGGDSKNNNRIDYDCNDKSIKGNKLITKYKIPLRDYKKQYSGSLYLQEIKGINDGEYVYDMGGTYVGYNDGFMQINTNFSEPIITSTSFTSDTVIDEWNGGTILNIGGSIIGSYTGYSTVYDSNNKVISARKQFIINKDNSYGTSIKLTNVEKNNDDLRIVIEDNFGKSVEKIITSPKIDTKAPSIINEASIKLNDGWAKSKILTLELEDNGIGEVSTAINFTDAYTNAVKVGKIYKQTYTFTGDIYSEKNLCVYHKDKLNNFNTTIKPIDKIDNTPPTITNMSTNTDKNVKSVILTVEANDLNTTLNKQGSGNLQYRFYSSNNEINNNNLLLNKWGKSNNVPIYENGTYYVEVRDLVENSIISDAFKIKNIDNKAPTVDVSFSNSGDGKYKIVTIEALEEATKTSKMSGLKQNKDGELDCFSIVSAEDNKSVECSIATKETTSIETVDDEIILYKRATAQFKTNENKKFVIQVQDNALNNTLMSVTIDANDIGLIDDIDGENLDFKRKYPEWTNGTVKLTAYINKPSYLYMWSWDYPGSLSEYQKDKGSWYKGFYGTWNGILSSYHSFTVNENGTYQVVAVDENGVLYNRSTTVKNIDKEVPTCTVSTENNSIVINASDEDSGIDYIMVDGGSLTTIQQIYCYGSKEVQVAAKISANSNYKILVYDKAGNISDPITKTISSIEPDAIYHTVTFCNYDNSVIKSELVKEGEDATPPANLTRSGYTFTGWDKPYSNIKTDTTITAQFSEGKANEYFSVNFCNYDGTIIKSQRVEDGADATPPANITRSGYTFTGWDKGYSNVTQDVITTAQFEKGTSDKFFSVTFCNYDGSIIKSQNVKMGTDATPPTTIARDGYVFTGWDKSYSNITENTTITAQLEKGKADKYFSVDFCNYDGSIIKSQNVKGGTDATPPTTITRNGYIFTGWDKSYSNVNKDAVITALFKIDMNNQVMEEKTYYTVGFYNYDGSIIKSQTVEKGAEATPPTTVNREGYTFTGWSGSYSNVKEDIKAIAMFKANANVGIRVGQTAQNGTKSTIPLGNTSVKKTEGHEVKEVEKNKVLLTEYTEKALPLSISEEKPEGDSNERYQGSVDLVQEEDIPSTTESISMKRGLATKQVGAIVILVLVGAGTAFYFLNKKYYWCDLPF